MDKEKAFKEHLKTVRHLMVAVWAIIGVIAIICIYLLVDPSLSGFSNDTPDESYVSVPETEDEDAIVDGIHVRTGFVAAEGVMTVVNNCTNCHSAQLVIQNRMNTERWITTIRWMQETQNLWDLGLNEAIIVNYLVTNYPPSEKGRRQALGNIDWYPLDD